MKEFYKQLLDKIVEAEKNSGRYYTSFAKRDFVINAIANSLPLPWWMPRFAAKWIVGLLVDLVIYIYNRLAGHGWLKKFGAVL
jgi:hypothetical protein